MNKQGKYIRISILTGLLLSVFSLSSLANGLHPEVLLLDALGAPVVESGLPMSTMTSCGGECHQTSYIMANSDHADAGAFRGGQRCQRDRAA